MQSYDSDTPDAATLSMPLVFLVSPNDPPAWCTATMWMERSTDGLRGEEGTFSMCTFFGWRR